MENQGWPKFDLFPRLTKVGRAIGHVLSGPHVEGYGSDYPKHPERTEYQEVDPQTHVDGCRNDIEHLVGHLLIANEMTAEEALEALNYFGA